MVRRALEEGPQTITRHGEEAVVVISAKEFRRLKGVPEFRQFLLSGPSFDDLDLERQRDLAREIDL